MATALRAAKPKLTLAVPATANPLHAAHAAPKSPFPRAVSPSPMTSPTARNTRLNQRVGMLWASHPPSPLPPPRSPRQVLTAQSHTAASLGVRGGLKKRPGAQQQQQPAAARDGRRVSVQEEPSVKCVSPMPEDYYGEYRRLSRDERRWVALM